jgi:hypothetical protein
MAVECADISRFDNEMNLSNRITKIDIKMLDRGAATGIHVCVTEDLERLPGRLTTFSTETSQY